MVPVEPFADHAIHSDVKPQLLLTAILVAASVPDTPQIFKTAESGPKQRIAPVGMPQAVSEPDSIQPNNPVNASPALSIGPSITGPLGPWYYPARLLHRRVTPLAPIRPTYPVEAESIAGRVVLLLFVNETGGIDRYRIEDSEPSDIFEPAIVEAFVRKGRYAPGRIGGRSVKAELRIEVSFQPGIEPLVNIQLQGPIRPLQKSDNSRGSEN